MPPRQTFFYHRRLDGGCSCRSFYTIQSRSPVALGLPFPRPRFLSSVTARGARSSPTPLLHLRRRLSSLFSEDASPPSSRRRRRLSTLFSDDADASPPSSPAAKHGGRLLLKAQKRKMKKNKISDECNGVSVFPFEFKKTPKSPKDKCKKHCRYEKKRLLNVKESNTEEVQRVVDEERVKEISLVVDDCTRGIKKKFKKDCKRKKVPQLVKESNIEEVQRVLDDEKVDEIYLVDKDCTRGMKKKFKKDCKQKKKPLQNVEVSDIEEVQRVTDEEKIDEISFVDEDCAKGMKKKVKNGRKHKKKCLQDVKESNTKEVQRVIDEEKVDEISLVDEDCSRGMKKWLMQYKKSRPGIKVLQQRIDEFVTFHEEQREQERKEREAHAAEGGWTVVVHHKGRKKTTEAETGTAVGSVASAAVMDKMSKKKAKEIPLDFYRFQKRDAKRNEIMMLQSRFEQDKKRIQQLRAARKFKPY